MAWFWQKKEQKQEQKPQKEVEFHVPRPKTQVKAKFEELEVLKKELDIEKIRFELDKLKEEFSQKRAEWKDEHGDSDIGLKELMDLIKQGKESFQKPSDQLAVGLNPEWATQKILEWAKENKIPNEKLLKLKAKFDDDGAAMGNKGQSS